VKAWESKNAKNAARAGGVSLMALSLAACGGSSDTTNASASDDTAADDTAADDTATGTDAGDVDAPTTPVVASNLRATLDADELTGTSGADEFVAGLGQNAFGGVANTLSSADSVAGGAGADTLDAELVSEFIGAIGDVAIDVQPSISGVETVRFEARDVGAAIAEADNYTVTVDAKKMTGHDSVGSYYSDGDLVIENMNTLTDAGDIRLTSDITITMAYTDSFNSDADASDLTVYFDEDYLNTSVDTSGSTLTIQVVNAVTNVDNGNPLFGTTALTVNVGDQAVAVDLTAIAEDDTLTFATAYDAAVEAINAAMTAAGFTTVTAAVEDLTPAVFSIGVTVDETDYTAGDSAGSFHPILVTNTGAEELTGGEFTQAQTDEVTDINSNMQSTVAAEVDVPISINIDLEKVGRDGEGGDLMVGAKDLNSNGDSDVDQNDGIEVFNINVIGDSDLPSNLGAIASTNDELLTVNIATDAAETGADGYAALTVRGTGDSAPFGGTLTRLDADDFLGDLYIGSARNAFDIDTFTATGGGDIDLSMAVGDTNVEDDGVDVGLDSTGSLARSVTTGAGEDTISMAAFGGAQLVVNTGAGDDTIVVDIDGNTDSESTESSLDLTSASGDNLVELNTIVAVGDVINAATVDLGSGDDTVTGGSVALTVDTGAGDDVIYADNTGDFASAVAAAGEGAGAYDATLLFNQSMTITLAVPDTDAGDGDAIAFVNGYEITTAINTDGFISTELELYQAVADAINGDAVANKLVSASLDSNGNLTVDYLIDGLAVADDISVNLLMTGEYADLTNAEAADLLEAYQAEIGDSDATAGDLETAYDLNTDVELDVIYLATDLGTDSVAASGFNEVNGGTGDDVIVLSSNADDAAGTIDTLVMDAGDFGDDVIVHFDVADAGGAEQDIMSFSFLDNTSSASGSDATAVAIGGTVALVDAVIENSVVVTDMASLGALDFETMTEAQVLAEIEDGGVFDVDAAGFDGDRVGDDVKAIIMIEDDENAVGADDNEGFFKVYEVTYDADAAEFTSVNLAGTLDFLEPDDILSLATANIA
jgi:hypothetical protein